MTTPQNSGKNLDLSALLGEPRFQIFLEESDYVPSAAEELYRWNLELAGAFHGPLANFEVVTRNAIDHALRSWNDRKVGTWTWSLDGQAGELLYGIIGRELRTARKWAKNASGMRPRDHPRRNAEITHDDVVAQLTMGNWAKILGASGQERDRVNAAQLWEEGLHKAFPEIGNSDEGRKVLANKYLRLSQLRNRISHHEQLLKVNPRSRINDLTTALAGIGDDVAAWSMRDLRIRKVAQRDPRKRRLS